MYGLGPVVRHEVYLNASSAKVFLETEEKAEQQEERGETRSFVDVDPLLAVPLRCAIIV